MIGCQVSLFTFTGSWESIVLRSVTNYLTIHSVTELSKSGPLQAMAPKYDGLSHCKLALVFAVLMDLLGVTSLLLGVFAPLEIRGRDFGDFLVYSGALLVLLSLAGWVLWYSGNIEGLTSRKELGGAMGGAVDRLARSLSRRIRLPRTRSSPT
ncbi:transmembrane protein 238-like [Syngnathoides biaculeatus]|uniref:transmembrane protein 238-like n=1 Tax=Syngnathoides biaculeatus TaxID=300417 RepID=UPI002ADDACFD|nr:transmembrane protein 238-like [Syngnathoides biaculeatus]